jgi:hypothetical protein
MTCSGMRWVVFLGAGAAGAFAPFLAVQRVDGEAVGGQHGAVAVEQAHRALGDFAAGFAGQDGV